MNLLKDSLELPKKEMLQKVSQLFSLAYKNELSDYYTGKPVKFEEYKPEIWKHALSKNIEEFELKVLENLEDSTILEVSEIKLSQLQDRGQIVETVMNYEEDELMNEGLLKLVFCKINDDFVIVKTEITILPKKKGK